MVGEGLSGVGWACVGCIGKGGARWFWRGAAGLGRGERFMAGRWGGCEAYSFHEGFGAGKGAQYMAGRGGLCHGGGKKFSTKAEMQKQKGALLEEIVEGGGRAARAAAGRGGGPRGGKNRLGRRGARRLRGRFRRELPKKVGKAANLSPRPVERKAKSPAEILRFSRKGLPILFR